MDLKKVLDQTVRELKREVNKTILKVPEIEQKVLDATSNEAWGPHGTLMAEIAQATRNYYELQMIMAVLWKRLSDTGRNWRHVYKALTVLEYLVAHGSERVIDDIREHAYQISTLADFQYVEPNGKDQGINVQRKSQNLVVLVNDKEKIREVRQKAADNRDKYRGVSSTGGMSKPSSFQSTGGSYGGDRYEEDNYSRHGMRDDDRYSRDRDADRYRDDDRYVRDSERSSRPRDRYRDHHNRDDVEDVDYYVSRKADDQYGDKHRAGNDTEHQSSRGPIQKPATTTTSGPPGYDEASHSPDYHAAGDQRESKSFAGQSVSASSANTPYVNDISDEFDDFNPRATSVAAPSQLDDLFNQSEPRATVRTSPPPPVSSSFLASDIFGDVISSSVTAAPPLPIGVQNIREDLFGNSPFKVEASGTSTAVRATVKPPPNYAPPPTGNGMTASVLPGSGTLPASIKPPPTFSAGNVLAPVGGATFDTFVPAASSGTLPASIKPPPTSSAGNVLAPVGGDTFDTFAPAASSANQAAALPFGGDDFFGLSVSGAVSSSAPQPAFPSNALTPQAAMPGVFQTSEPSSTSLFNPSQSFLASQGQSGYTRPQQEKRFETKSAVWADSLSKGLIDLNLAGPKSNPRADIGIDFDQLRTDRMKDERMLTGKSTTGMGKAMGSGSGLGMAGASAVVPPAVPTAINNLGMAPTMGMGMNMGMGIGAGMGPMMQMGFNSGLAVRPSAGIGSPGLGIGMGKNSGSGGFSNHQQQYGGFR